MRETTREALIALFDLHKGQITPKQVVEAARNPESPLHDEFEWDEAKAAERHWLDRARSLIRDVKIVIEHHSHAVTVPLMMRNPETPAREQGYATIDRIRSNEYSAREAAVAEFKRAASALARARSVAIALGRGDDIDELIVRLTGMAATLSDDTEDQETA